MIVDFSRSSVSLPVDVRRILWAGQLVLVIPLVARIAAGSHVVVLMD